MDWKAETESVVRDILDAWARSVPDHPFKDFGKSAELVSIAEKPSFALELRTLYDVRTKPEEVTKPYDEALKGSLVTKPVPPEQVDVWSFDAALKKEFVTQEAAIEVSTSFRSIPCSICEGSGTWTCQVCSGSTAVSCSDCQGSGRNPCEKCIGRAKIPCSYCRGKGYLPGVSKDNKPAADIPCSNCNGAGGQPCEACGGKGGFPCKTCQSKGKIPCAKCQAKGTQPCPQCGAKGKTLRGLAFKVTFMPRRDHLVMHDPAMPQELMPAQMPEGRGNRVLEKEGESVAGAELPAAQPYLKTAFDGLMRQSEEGKAAQNGQAKIVRQLVHVDRIPVFAVVYRYGGKIFDVWLTALDNRTSAKESPFKDFAREQAMKAMSLATKGQHAEAEELLSKARAIAGGDVSLEAAKDVSQGTAAQGFLDVHRISSGIAGFALMAFLAYRQGPTGHLFWPVFSFGVGALAAAMLFGAGLCRFKAAWVPNTSIKRIGASVGLTLLVAAASAGAFSVAQWPLKLDTRDYRSRMAERFPAGLAPENMNDGDRNFLEFMIMTFEPLGVDVSDAKKAIADFLQFQEQAKQAALAQAEAERKAAEEKARLLRQIEAEKKKQAAALAARKKKSKKKKKRTYGN